MGPTYFIAIVRSYPYGDLIDAPCPFETATMP